MKQAERFSHLAPNMIVKIPVTRAGIPAIEEATYRGITINATVCFSLPQCVAVAEAVERGLHRQEAEGKDMTTSPHGGEVPRSGGGERGEAISMGPGCTIMVGWLDDWLKVVMEKGQ